jgi:hypothetical protein
MTMEDFTKWAEMDKTLYEIWREMFIGGAKRSKENDGLWVKWKECYPKEHECMKQAYTRGVCNGSIMPEERRVLYIKERIAELKAKDEAVEVGF